MGSYCVTSASESDAQETRRTSPTRSPDDCVEGRKSSRSSRVKSEMRHVLAREPYEKKIQKVEQLLRLVREFPRRRKTPVNETPAAARVKSRS